MNAITTFPRRAVIFLIELYRSYVSPMRMPTCRFEPSCSTYAVEALEVHGFIRGGALSVWRLLKCGPWHKPGYDPVPERSVPERPVPERPAPERRTTHLHSAITSNLDVMHADRG